MHDIIITLTDLSNNRLLLQGGANVNAIDNDGWTPLHAAAHWEEEEACKILGEYGASFDAKNYSVIRSRSKTKFF